MEQGIFWRSRLAAIVLAAASAACGGGGDGGNGPAPSIQVAANPTSLTIEQGSSNTVNLTLVRGGGFSGSVTATVTGLPPEITVTVSPSTLTGTTSAAVVTVAVGATTAPGSYTATITGTASGVGSAAATFGVTVTAKPNVTLALSAPALTVQQGTSSNTTVNITRTNFTGDVALTLVGPLPTGVDGAFNPASTTGNTSTLTVNASSAAVPGIYTLTVRSTPAGIGERTTTLTLTVTAAPQLAITVAPTSMTIQQGGNGPATVTITRSGFTGDVTLALVSQVAGITGSFVPNPLPGTSSDLTVSVAASVPTGNHTVTVRATATGVGERTAPLAITVTSPGTYALSVNPAALSIQQGASKNTTVDISRTNFAGNVTLTLEGPPGVAGVSGTFAPATTGGNSSTLSVNVAAGVALGNYTLTIRGTAAGLADRTIPLALTVTTPPPASSIAIALQPQNLSLAQNSQGETFVNITRTNFGLPVTLAYTGQPAGVTVSFDENPVVANQTRMRVAVAANAAVGNYLITVTASGANVPDASANVALQVQPTSTTQVEVQFCSDSENPVFLAYQDGAGPWQRALPLVLGNLYRYTFNLSQNRGGLFFVQQSGTASPRWLAGARLRSTRQAAAMRTDATAARRLARPSAASAFTYETIAFFGTVAEMKTLGMDNCAATQTTKTVSLNVAGVPTGQAADLSLGGVTETFLGGITTSPVTFSEVRQGAIDFFGVRAASLFGTPNKLLDVRGLNPPDGSTLPFTADFGSASAYDPVSALLTVGNLLGDEVFGVTSFTTVNGEAGTLGTLIPGMTPGVLPWYGVPNAKLQVGDLHANIVFASPASSTTDEARLFGEYTTTVQNRTVTFGSRLATPTLTSLGGLSYRRFRLQGALPAEYSDLVEASFGASGGGGNEITVLATGAWLAASGFTGSYDLSIPDLTAIGGFPLESGLPGGQIEGLLSASGWTGAGILFPTPANGLVFTGASKTVKTVVP